MPLNPSTYSLSARAVFGTSNIFPTDGNVGIGTLNPQAKLDIEGKLRIADVPIILDDIPNILVHDTDNDQIVKQVPFDSLLVKIISSGAAGPVGPAGPIGPIGPKGPAGGAGGAGEDGEDLVVRDSTGKEVFRVNAKDGTSWHKGEEVFEGGIIVAKDSLSGLQITPDGELIIYDSTGTVSTKILNDGTSFHHGHEYFEAGITVGHIDSSTNLIIGKSGQIGIYDKFGIPYWEVDNEGKSAHYGLETFYDGIKISQDQLFNFGFISLNQKEGLVIANSAGDTVTTFSLDGKSYHKGLETYEGGLVVGNDEGAHTSIGTDGKISVHNSNGELTTTFYPDGTSRHTGLEIYEGGLKVGAPDSSYFTVRNNGEFGVVKDGQWTSHFKPDGTSFHYGPEVFYKGIFIGGEDDLSRTHIAPDGKIQIIDGENKVVTQFKPDGTSWHKGLETYAGGIEVPFTGGGKAVISHDPNIGIAIFDASGNFVQHLKGDGQAFHSQGLHVGGTISATNLNVSGEKNFIIDHPLDPLNKSLVHRSIESSDRLNFYNGNIKLNRKGRAEITLPVWFEALNKDFRYQLTAVGKPGPKLYVAKKISDNKFIIAGGKKGMEVSWQVTGNRKDKFSNNLPPEVEIKKATPKTSAYIKN